MSKKILLVEDEALIAMSEAQMLKTHGYDVVTAYKGEKAIEMVGSDPEISLILMDIDLGRVMDGTKAAEKILNKKDIPIVFLSSHTEPEVVEKTEKITSYGYVVKNSGATVLDASIKMAFRLFDARRKEKEHKEALQESEATIRKRLKAITEPEGDIGSFELADIIDYETLQTMMEDFYKISKIGCSINDTSGNILVSVGWQDICTKFHRVHPDTLKNCLESDVMLSRNVPVGSFKVYHCKNNMWDIATPVMVDNKHLGNIFLGQFFFEDETPDYERFKKQARQYGFNETEYLAALDRVPRFSRETVESAMAFYSRLAGMISSLSYTTIKLSRNIVQHKQAEEALKASRDLLNATQKIARVGGWEWDVATDTVTWSEELYTITGLDSNAPPPQFNDDHHKIYTEESWQKLTSVVESTLTTGEPYELYAQMIRPNGELRDVFIYGGSNFDSDGSISGLFGIVEDITDKKQREKKLRESEENLRITLNSIGDAVISTDIGGAIVRMNPVAENLCGWSIDEAKGKSLTEVFRIVNADTGKKAKNPVAKVIETGSIVGLANHTMLISKNGEKYQIADSAAPIRDDSGHTSGVVLVFRDVTEEELRESNKTAHQFFSESAAGAFFMMLDEPIEWNDSVDKEEVLDYVFDHQHITKINRAMLDQYLARDEDFFGKTPNQLFAHDVEHGRSLWRKMFDQGYLSIDSNERRFDGSQLWIVGSYRCIYDEQGRITGHFGTQHEITERRQAEEKLKEALKEKDFLMQELNHRLKNNLLMVSSLVSLKDSETEIDLSDLKHQIEAISLIHEKLYQTESVAEIGCREYFDDLLKSIFSSFTTQQVRIEEDTDDIYVSTKTAVCLGIIINEIATNAIKHGFSDIEEAVFSIKMKTGMEKKCCKLTLSNTGNPFPDEVDVDNTNTLGLRLINTLVAQIGGTVELQKRPKPVFTIWFPAGE